MCADDRFRSSFLWGRKQMLAAVAARLRHQSDLVWVDLGGGTGVRHSRDRRNIRTFVCVSPMLEDDPPGAGRHGQGRFSSHIEVSPKQHTFSFFAC